MLDLQEDHEEGRKEGPFIKEANVVVVVNAHASPFPSPQRAASALRPRDSSCGRFHILLSWQEGLSGRKLACT